MTHEDTLIFALWELRQALPRALDAELEPVGLTMVQFGTLNAVAVGGPQSGADLARRANVRPQTMASMVSPLVDAGLLQRRPHPVHRRIVLLGLSAEGRRRWRTGSARVRRVEGRLGKVLGQGGYDAMFKGTRDLVAALGGLQAVPPIWPADH